MTLRNWLGLLAWLVPLGVLAQAALAGQAWFLGADLMELHGGIGHGVLLVSLVVAVLAWVGSGIGRGPAVLATLTLVGLVAQTGLGYSGRRGEILEASAVHIPLGVALAALSLILAWMLSARPSAGRDATAAAG